MEQPVESAVKITREQAIEAIRCLDLDEDHVRNVDIDSRGVTVTRFVLQSDGSRLVVTKSDTHTRFAFTIDRYEFESHGSDES